MRTVLIPALITLIAVTVLGTGCTRAPNEDGGYIPDPPPYFGLDINASQSGKDLPGRTLLDEKAYITFGGDEHSSIYITTFEGVATDAEVEAAYEQARDQRRHATFGPFENEYIDQRNGWSWTETQSRRKSGEVVALKYLAVLPYDEVTYVVEFYTSQETYLDIDFLRTTVRTFKEARPETDHAAMFIGATLLVLGGVVFAKLRG